MNVDRQAEEGPDVVLNLGCDPWPFEDDSVDEVVASHILEHLTTDEFFHCMKEMYRVCRNGAKVKVTLPHPSHDIFVSDITHQRPIMPGTMLMFSKSQMEDLRAKGMILTPFWKYLGVDFHMDPQVQYSFDRSVDPNDPNLEWKAKHLRNILQEWATTLTVVK